MQNRDVCRISTTDQTEVALQKIGQYPISDHTCKWAGSDLKKNWIWATCSCRCSKSKLIHLNVEVDSIESANSFQQWVHSNDIPSTFSCLHDSYNDHAFGISFVTILSSTGLLMLDTSYLSTVPSWTKSLVTPCEATAEYEITIICVSSATFCCEKTFCGRRFNKWVFTVWQYHTSSQWTQCYNMVQYLSSICDDQCSMEVSWEVLIQLYANVLKPLYVICYAANEK